MKLFKKMITFVLVALMTVAMGATNVFAEDSFTITIDNAVKGETYKAYKVFDATYANPVTPAPVITPATDIPGEADQTHFNSAYSYTINTNSTFWNDLTTGVTPAEGVYTLATYGLKFVPSSTSGTYNVLPIASTGVTEAQAQALAAFLAGKLAGKTPAASAKATAGTTDPDHEDYIVGALSLDVTASGAGYYFVDTTMGSLCSLNTTEPNAVIREKNSIPSDDKKVSDAADGTFGEEATVKVGDTVYFKIEIKDSKGTDKKVTVHDEMDNALTLDIASFAIKVDDVAVPATNYTIKVNNAAITKGENTGVTPAVLEDGCTFEIEFTDAYIAELAENKDIVITYAAELNANAKTADPFQVNKSHIKYSEQNTVEKTVIVKTYEADIVKTDDQKKILDGATFNLYDVATAGTKYNLVKVEDGKYRIAVSTDASTAYAAKLQPKDGKLTIVGLENGTYYLEEVDHPDGYNPLTERKSFTIANANSKATIEGTTYKEGGVQVINQSGTELPSTGGIGTTIFYVLGGLMVVGAGIVLVARRKASE